MDQKKQVKNIALFASGSGTNVENIVKYFATNPNANVKLILSNKKDAFVLERAKNLGVKAVVFNREQFVNTNEIVDLLLAEDIHLVVLAGFLWLVPINLVQAFPNKILNIHPALLPKYGGKGMYGMKVHEAVVANNEKESGITIHTIDENYDEGSIILQKSCEVAPDDTPEQVAQKVHALEYEYYPKVIEQILKEI